MSDRAKISILDLFRKDSNKKDLLRSELFDADQMRAYGRILAGTHALDDSWLRTDRLLIRLDENEAVLKDVRIMLTDSVLARKRIVNAAEWLLDNFYLIEEHMRASRRDLPKGYSRQLPRLAGGDSAGLPRVYDIALQRISHCDGLVDPETLPGFIKSYQAISVLTLGELWAIPIMMRLALVENIRRIAARITDEMEMRERADFWADRMIALEKSDPKSLILLVADMARSNPLLVSSFVAEMSRKLQGRGSALALPLTWIEQMLSETGLSVDSLVQAEMQQQAADQVSIENTIHSLRSLAAKDWRDFVEKTSVVEKNSARTLPEFTRRWIFKHGIITVMSSRRRRE